MSIAPTAAACSQALSFSARRLGHAIARRDESCRQRVCRRSELRGPWRSDLSRFAGAAAEFKAALLVNPFDPEVLAISIAHALSMPVEERRERHAAMFSVISKHHDQILGKKIFLVHSCSPSRAAGLGQFGLDHALGDA